MFVMDLLIESDIFKDNKESREKIVRKGAERMIIVKKE